MLALPLVLGWLVLTSEPVPPAGTGYRPGGTAVDLHDLGRLARLREPSLGSLVFDKTSLSPSDRPVLDRNGDTVLAEVRGPGIVQRFWIGLPSLPSHAVTQEALARHLRFYLDGDTEPALDLSVADLAAGRHPHFPRPLVGSLGGLVCQVPIPFQRGCRIVAEGEVRWPVLFSVLSLPDAEGIESFTPTPGPDERADLDRASAFWSHPEKAESPGSSETAEFLIDAEARSTHVFLLPAGPRTIRSFELLPSVDTAEAWRTARVRLIWDGDDPEEPGVDVAFGPFFARPVTGASYQSVLTGCTPSVWSNRMPMPYRRQALLQIDSERPITGSIRIRSQPGREPDSGYLRAASTRVGANDSSGRWLCERGRGHMVGTVVTFDAQDARPGWNGHLARFSTDGEASRHTSRSDRYVLPERLFTTLNTNREIAGPLFGLAKESRGGSSPCVSAFDWHLVDPILFARSVEAGPRTEEQPTSGLQATAFWYAERPATIHPGD